MSDEKIQRMIERRVAGDQFVHDFMMRAIAVIQEITAKHSMCCFCEKDVAFKDTVLVRQAEGWVPSCRACAESKAESPDDSGHPPQV